jgi:hypothetical protein
VIIPVPTTAEPTTTTSTTAPPSTTTSTSPPTSTTSTSTTVPTTTTTLPELDPVPSLTVPDLTATTLPTSTTAVAPVPTTDPPSGGGDGGLSTDAQVFLLIGAFLLVAVVVAAFTVRYWQRTKPVPASNEPA